jgi:hypothetical protein
MSSAGPSETSTEGSGKEVWNSIEAASEIAKVDRPLVTLNCCSSEDPIVARLLGG